MPVYVDVLFITNYIINMLLLISHAKLCGRRRRRMRLVFSALFGALSSLCIFLPYQGVIASNIYKLLISASMVFIVSSFSNFKQFVKEWVLFFAVSFIFAGIMLGIHMFANPQNMFYYNGIVYFDISPVVLIVAVAISYVMLEVIWRLMKKSKTRGSGYKITVKSKSNIAEMEAIMDTGNRLHEPFSGSPVIICRLQALKPIFTDEQMFAFEKKDFEAALKTGIKLRFVPYKVIGDNGVMPAFRADEILLEGLDANTVKIEDAYLAISDDAIKYDAILNADLDFCTAKIV